MSSAVKDLAASGSCFVTRTAMTIQLYRHTTFDFVANAFEFLVIFPLKYEHDIYFPRIRIDHHNLSYYREEFRHEKSRCDTKSYNNGLRR
jgi:hypothetical protein